jgi:hypothetical protein
MQCETNSNKSHPRRALRQMGIPVAIAVATFVVLAGGLYAATLANHTRIDVPAETVTPSYHPDVAASPDGEDVAVAWSDGMHMYAAGQGSVYLAYGSETGGGWQKARAYPEAASRTNLATRPAIAFDPRPGHSTGVRLVWSQNQGTTTGFNRILHAACDLADFETCSSVTSSTVRFVAAGNVLMPDIVVDKAGMGHVVWLEEQDSSGSGVYYAHQSDAAWSPPTRLSPLSHQASRPAVAYAGVGAAGCLHVAWAGGAGEAYTYIAYRRIDLGGNDCGGDRGPLYFDVASSYAYGHSDPHNASIAAAGDRVYLFWDVAAGRDSGIYQVYHIVYNTSADGGETWQRPDDGDEPEYLDFPGGGIAFSDHLGRDEEVGSRLQFARPHPYVTLEGDGVQARPHLVWSEAITWPENTYQIDVFHSYSQTGWLAAENLTQGTKSLRLHSALPVAVVGARGSLHVAYMQEARIDSSTWWDSVYYQGPIEERGAIYLPIVLQ